MKKSILDLPGVQIIEKNTQSTVNGGAFNCSCGNRDANGRCLCHTSV